MYHISTIFTTVAHHFFLAYYFQKITTWKQLIKIENIDWAATKINLSVQIAEEIHAEQIIGKISKYKREGGGRKGGEKEKDRMKRPNAV